MGIGDGFIADQDGGNIDEVILDGDDLCFRLGLGNKFGQGGRFFTAWDGREELIDQLARLLQIKITHHR
jgi:hypothetical protein